LSSIIGRGITVDDLAPPDLFDDPVTKLPALLCCERTGQVVLAAPNALTNPHRLQARVGGVEELRPFDLVPVKDGCFELGAFSDDTEDPITITPDPDYGRRLAAAIGEALSYLAAGDAQPRRFEVRVGSSSIRVVVLPESGVRLVVTR
jgi:hypothetical protein